MSKLKSKPQNTGIQIYRMYLNERFPLLPALFFSTAYILLASGVSRHTNLEHLSLLLICNFFFFLLRLRIIDEFKDTTHDLLRYPNRPFSRGQIKKTQLLVLLFVASIGEIVPVLFLPTLAKVCYGVVFLYSLLMSQEFFIKQWITEHFTSYFLLHEVIFIFYSLFILVSYQDTRSMFLKLILLISLPVQVEVIRKFSPRYDTSKMMVQDTYGAVWGKKLTLLVIFALSLSMAITLSYLKQSAIFLWVSIFSISAWILLGWINDKLVALVGVCQCIAFILLTHIL